MASTIVLGNSVSRPFISMRTCLPQAAARSRAVRGLSRWRHLCGLQLIGNPLQTARKALIRRCVRARPKTASDQAVPVGGGELRDKFKAEQTNARLSAIHKGGTIAAEHTRQLWAQIPVRIWSARKSKMSLRVEKEKTRPFVQGISLAQKESNHPFGPGSVGRP